MKIVQIAAEFAPIAKAGGLGEVVLGISRELIAEHHQVDVIIPKYSLIDSKALAELKIEAADFRIKEKGLSISNTMWSALVEECPLHLLEARHPSGYFHRDKIYGFDDDIVRFLYFSRAVIEYLKLKNEPIDILHLHDWHTSACAALVREIFEQTLKVDKIVLTIHNLEYQGKCASRDLDAIGLGDLIAAKMQDPDPRYPETVNLLKGGIIYADAVTTVSPSYAKEILTKELGFGLEAVLKKIKPLGILNGIDSKIWNPATDPHLPAHYSFEDSLAKIVKAKLDNKKQIQKLSGLHCTDRPFIGAITRLVPQKGTDLLEQAIHQTIEKGGVFALLGSSPVNSLQAQFNKLKERYKGHPQVLLQYEYNDALAHLLYSALDFILVPSLSEPCGLTQLIAFRYGTIPIVHSTGGLKDTVFDCEDGKNPIERRNGFVFYRATPEEQQAAILRALALQRSDPATFQAMMRRVMKEDHSWKTPAKIYLQLFKKILS